MPRLQRRESSTESINGSGEADILTDVDRIVPLSGMEDQFNSVIKVFVSTSKPNYMMPWQMNRQEQCTGSAFVIEPVGGRRVMLTNAHVVRDFATVRVRRHGGSEKWEAKVLTVNDTCDLALITVEDDLFWNDLQGLVITETLPELYENTMVVGYPMGGDNICVTRGVVSRVTTLTYEDTKFFLPTRELIAIQLDAAINSGNSGGPALDENGRIVGVAFSGYAGSADNIGYIIPYPVISNFLGQFEADPTAKNTICDLGFSYMLCENPSLRAKNKMKKGDSGVLVTKVAPLAAANKAGLKENDVLVAIGGSQIGNDGTIEFRRGERLSFRHKIGGHVVGKPLEMQVLRDGKTKSLTAEGRASANLVQRHREPGELPCYFIVGGVVFSALTCGLLDVAVEVLSEEAWQRGRGAIKERGEQVIVIITILAHPLMHGYEIGRLPLVTSVNGEKVKNMWDLKEKVDAVQKGFISFKLADGKSIILDAKQCRAEQDEILQKYQIPAINSLDLDGPEPVWDTDGAAAAKGGGAAVPKAAAKKKAAAKGGKKAPGKKAAAPTATQKKRRAPAARDGASKRRK